MKHLAVYWLTCVLLLAAAVANATTIVLPTDEQLVAKSPLIVEATVVRSVPVDRGHRIWTETTLAVTRVLKGNAAGEIAVGEVGGQIGNRVTMIFGAPAYVAGEHVLAFLTPTPRGDYQTVDLYVGKFSEQRTLAGERLWTRHDEAADVSLLGRDLKPLHAANVQRSADAFERFVAARAANQPAAQNYGVENPVLAAPAQKSTMGGQLPISSNFTLISEPRVYRWFAFDNGQSVKWYSSGSQSGYTGGGLNEIQTAMAAWTGYTSALIRYTYAGTESGTPQPLDNNNGVNEVLFNDPFAEISGTYNPATGGIVGVGGFNGVSGGGSWTGPFNADAGHTTATVTAFNITEAGLTIQDGVSPTAGISSNVLAEIVAHEFGHTLGFGHSTTSGALMYPSVTGLGPSLRPDDQTAARWLYPNGSQTPPPPTITVPAAPTGLAATVSGTSVTLTWTDNASNETGESVYYAAGSGSFTRVADLGAGIRGTTLAGFAPGTYRFYVTAFNSAGQSAPSNTVSATVASTAVTASFAVSPLSGTANSTVFTFTDQSTGTITARSWSFGDGTTSAATSPTHLYTSAGVFTVTLTVSGNGTTSQASRFVNVAQPVPVVPPVSAAFDFTPSAPSSGDTVTFNDRSTGSPVLWSWSFGDGATSALQNPKHPYLVPGTYMVTLTATSSTSSASVTHAVVVQAAAPFHSLVSATAQTNGAGGSVWRTELTLFNAGNESAFGQFIFIPGAGGSVQSRPLFLGPKQSMTLGNALLDLFGMSSGAGALAIEAQSAASTPNLKVTSRTFTTGSIGTYGQAVPQVSDSGLQQSLYMTGMESDAAFRTNVGLVNRSNAPVGAALTLLDANGNQVGATSVTLAANNFSQVPLSAYFPAVANGSFASLSMRILAGAPGALSAYASIIDNRSQDPLYVQAVPLTTGGAVVLPAVGRLPGANGTFWRSDVTLFNPTSFAQTLTLRYRAAGADGRNAPATQVTVAAGRTVVLADVLSAFNVTSGSGSLQVAWSGASAPVVTSRTYTTVAGGGTYGQSIDPVSAFGSDAYVPGLRSDASFRSNVGFVNESDSAIGVVATLLASNGQSLASAFVQLAPKSMTQSSVAALFPGVDPGSLGSVTLQAHTDTPGAMFAYGSIVDNGTGDPVFFAGQ